MADKKFIDRKKAELSKDDKAVKMEELQYLAENRKIDIQEEISTRKMEVERNDITAKKLDNDVKKAGREVEKARLSEEKDFDTFLEGLNKANMGKTDAENAKRNLEAKNEMLGAEIKFFEDLLLDY